MVALPHTIHTAENIIHSICCAPVEKKSRMSLVCSISKLSFHSSFLYQPEILHSFVFSSSFFGCEEFFHFFFLFFFGLLNVKQKCFPIIHQFCWWVVSAEGKFHMEKSSKCIDKIKKRGEMCCGKMFLTKHTQKRTQFYFFFPFL